MEARFFYLTDLYNTWLFTFLNGVMRIAEDFSILRFLFLLFPLADISALSYIFCWYQLHILEGVKLEISCRYIYLSLDAILCLSREERVAF